MHIIPPTIQTARRAAVAALCILPPLAACGGDRPARGESAAAADSVVAPPGDTSAMALAKQALGPDVRMAIPFRFPHRGAQFIAAAIPMIEWVQDPARSASNAVLRGHELVIVEVTPQSHAVHKPGLIASRDPFMPRRDDTAPTPPADSATLAKSMGVEDADGDGNPEAWAAEYMAGGRAYSWTLRAYDRNGRTLYEATASSDPRNDGCLAASSYEFSETVRQNPAIRPWLVRRLEALNASHPAHAGVTCPQSAAGAAR